MTSVRGEIAATFALAWPMVLTNVAINFMTTIDVMFLGRLSPDALAAGALGFNFYTPLFLFCVGVVSAAAPLAAAKLGADLRDFAGVRRVCHQALHQRARTGAAVLDRVVEHDGDPARDRRAARSGGARRTLHARPAMGAGAGAALHGGALDPFRAQPRAPGAAGRADRGRLQRPVQLRAGVRPFRPAGARRVRLRLGDHAGADADVRPARLVQLVRPQTQGPPADAEPLALRRRGIRQTLAARRADRRPDRARGRRLRLRGAGDGAHRRGAGRGARHRPQHRRHRLHGAARPRHGGDGARRPRLWRARPRRGGARRLDGVRPVDRLRRRLGAGDGRSRRACSSPPSSTSPRRPTPPCSPSR